MRLSTDVSKELRWSIAPKAVKADEKRTRPLVSLGVPSDYMHRKLEWILR